MAFLSIGFPLFWREKTRDLVAFLRFCVLMVGGGCGEL